MQALSTGPLDTLAIARALQAISSEIELNQLIDALLRTVLENTGAQSGLLILVQADELTLAAKAHVEGRQIAVQQLGVALSPLFAPLAVLDAARRSHEIVALADAREPNAFSADPYLQKSAPRSLLCLPLRRRAVLVGLLYLENNLVTDAFTSRLAVLDLLASQAAISLETARLYAALQEENAERKRSEATARERQARIERLVESNIIGIRFSDLYGRILDANDAYLDIIGYTRADLEAGRLRRANITPPEYHARDAAAREELRRNGRYEPYEKEYIRKDGTRVPVLVGGTLFEGRPPQSVAFVLNLAERKRAEAEREARRVAEVANRAKSRFLANMSHELRTPLNAVLGYAQLLQRDSSLSERSRFGVQTIEASGEHLLALINDILDLSRIEAGRLDLYPAATDLAACLRVVSDIMRVKAEEKSLLFVAEISPELPAGISVDERRLRQVLLNLLSNAVKFTDVGQVELRVRSLGPVAMAAADTPQIRLQVEVLDTGVGIAAADLASLFEPFEQVGEVSRRAAGSGLGLAISRALVHLMGGEITVDSTPGQGSRFRFEIPVAVTMGTTVGPAVEKRITGYTGRRRKVLIVEDVPANRVMLADFLRFLDFEIEEAADGLEGLTRAQAARPDVILMDNMMPVMDGLEATRRLRAVRGFERVPIIAISASASEGQKERSLAAGASKFLPKPFRLDEILRTIGSLLQLTWTYGNGDGAPQKNK
ncbi:MAG TPA: ATP-binding protein [Burkholderiaceae bacterium]|nr:ATP-binding protein [Burkholderiaceae bacterium]